MISKSFCTAALVVAGLVFACGAADKNKSTDFVIVTAPSGDFRLQLGNDSGRIWLVPAKNPGARAVLPPVEIEVVDSSGTIKKASSDTLESSPRCFISLDERWIFVSSGVLYQRSVDPSSTEALGFQPAIAGGFAEAAWRFFCRERNVSEDAIGIPNRYGNRLKNIEFCAWSADSARLLVALSGTIGQPKEPKDGGPTQYESSVSSWLCYFNTRTNSFEQTDRLRKANSEKRNSELPELAAEPGAVLSAEAIGQESAEISVNDRLKKADTELNDVYGKLLRQLSPVQKVELQNEERAWLQERDTFGAIHANQSWSPFPNASRIEGLAMATEIRVGWLRRRIANNQ
jgi:uncharacterized protein YecT (DUF1311 family)